MPRDLDQEPLRLGTTPLMDSRPSTLVDPPRVQKRETQLKPESTPFVIFSRYHGQA